MNKFFGHLKTVNKHRREVRKLCFKCGLYWQGLTHDLSKYSPIEFWSGVKYYTGTCSPHVAERKDKGYSVAWLHHKGHNKHHAEYWQDVVGEKTQSIYIPTKYFVEMVCDRIAASKIYLKDKYTDAAPLEYFLTHKDQHPLSIDMGVRLLTTLMSLKDHGEEATCKDLRRIVKEAKGKYPHFTHKKAG